MNPVDGTEVYQDDATRERCKQFWQQILKIMETIGFNSVVSTVYIIRSLIGSKKPLGPQGGATDRRFCGP